MREIEEWRPVVGFEGLYEVSSYGQVRSLDRWVDQAAGPRRTIARRFYPGRLLSPNTVGNGYLQVSLCRDGRATYRKVYQLVCEAFHGPKPDHCTQVRHLDGDTFNNYYRNVIWGTVTENEEDKKIHGRHQRGSRHAHTDLTERQVSEMYRSFLSADRDAYGRVKVGTIAKLVTDFGTTKNSVENIVYKRTWQHVTDSIDGDK